MPLRPSVRPHSTECQTSLTRVASAVHHTFYGSSADYFSSIRIDGDLVSTAFKAWYEGIGKAGGYAIQGGAAPFVRRINGSYTAIVGLPLYEAVCMLEGLGYR